MQGQQAALAGGLELGLFDRQFVQGQRAEGQVGLQVQGAQAVDRQQLVVAPGDLGRGVGKRRGARAGDRAGFLLLDLGLARGSGALGLFTLGRQVAVGVEGVALELQAQGLFGEVFDGHAATECAVIQLHRQVFQGQAVRRALQAGDQFQLGEGRRVVGGRQRAADAVEEGAQVELGDGQATAKLWRLVQVTQVQFAQGAQLVGRDFQAVPRGDIGGQVDQHLALGSEGHGLAAGGLARGFARQAHVFEVVALELAVEAQLAGQFGAGLDVRLAGT